MRPCFVYVSSSGRLDLLALWQCSSRKRFLKSVFFAMCVSITVSDSDRGG